MTFRLKFVCGLACVLARTMLAGEPPSLSAGTVAAAGSVKASPASEASAINASGGQVLVAAALEYIDTSIENASPLWWDVDPAGVVQVHLNYDHERGAPNRAAGHIHFLIQAKPGARLTLEFRNLQNIYNGRPGSIAGELKAVVVSEDGRHWRAVATRSLPDNRVLLDLEMPGPKLFVARVEPYRLSDLDALLNSIRGDARVQITEIGRTVEGRPLEIVRLGDAAAPHRVFLRARAHPWESGGNWVVQGLIRRLLRDNDDDSRRALRRCCVYILPMANKDGVARGRTRFNSNGKDLNRDWDRPAGAQLSPENHALEQWLESMIAQNQRPHLALELHNDGNGLLHWSQPRDATVSRYLERMQTLENLLRQHTWFTEGSRIDRSNVGTLGGGWLARYGIDALVHEFNCQWAVGLGRTPLGRDWERYGEGLVDVLNAYFAPTR